MALDYAQQLIVSEAPGQASPVLARWQNYFYNKKTSDGYSYKTFTCMSFTSGVDGDTGEFSIEFPFLPATEKLLLEYRDLGHIITARTLELSKTNISSGNFKKSTLVSAYIGRIEIITRTLTTVTAKLINSIDLSNAYAPPRKVTVDLLRGIPTTLRPMS